MSSLAVVLSTITALVVFRTIENYYDSSVELGSKSNWIVTPPPLGRSAVLITGAGTGLGKVCAKRLSTAGWIVFAGVLTEEERVELKSLNNANLVPILLNICDLDNVKQQVSYISQSDVRLVAVVNNANLTSAPGPLEFANVNGLRKCFEVGVDGGMKVVQATIPLLRASGKYPRIVYISSGAGILAVPFHGVYAMQKFAIEAAADTFRRELEDIAVSVIEPEMISTTAAMSWPELLKAIWSDEHERRYGQMRQKVEQQHHFLLRAGLTIDGAARAVCHAVSAKYPSARYRVGPASIATALLALLPSKLADVFIALFQFRRPLSNHG
jgi:NADP-dependent 3-hydroxy acid dehydrogenase YdfG